MTIVDRNCDKPARLSTLTVGIVLFAFGVVGITSYVLFELRQDVDVKSGRLRLQRAIGPFIFWEEIHDTKFSTQMGIVVPSNAAVWHRANTVGVFGTHSPYGAAISELKRFAILCESGCIDRSSCRAVGNQLLKLLEMGDIVSMSATVDECAANDCAGLK